MRSTAIVTSAGRIRRYGPRRGRRRAGRAGPDEVRPGARRTAWAVSSMGTAPYWLSREPACSSAFFSSSSADLPCMIALTAFGRIFLEPS